MKLQHLFQIKSKVNINHKSNNWLVYINIANLPYLQSPMVL